MATEAQILANRANAQKSTGPRTAEGKAVVARNAIQHGLTAGLDVIPGEDREQFECQREALLEELRPGGVVETMLAERVVGLSWRLQRVGRLQNEVFEALLAGEAPPPAEPALSRVAGQAAQEDGLARGRAVLKDFATGRVLDRLLLYERRIENSLFKTFRDLQLRRREPTSRQRDEIGSPQGGSLKFAVSSLKSDGSGFESPALPTSHFTLRTSSEPPAGVATSAPPGVAPPAETPHYSNLPSFHYPAVGGTDADRMSATQVPQRSHIPSFRYSTGAPGGPAAAGLSCKTKPICPEPEEGQVLCRAGVTDSPAEDDGEETKPISAWQAAPAVEAAIA